MLKKKKKLLEVQKTVWKFKSEHLKKESLKVQ